MDREQIEKEFSEIIEKTKGLIDSAYVCGYRDGYFECMIHKYKSKNDDEIIEPKNRIQLTVGGRYD